MVTDRKDSDPTIRRHSPVASVATTQVNGVVFVEDFSGLQLSDYVRLSNLADIPMKIKCGHESPSEAAVEVPAARTQ